MSDNSPNDNSFDPSLRQLGSVYAKALFGAAEKAGNTDAVVEQFDSFVDDVVTRLPNLESVLSSPRVPHAEKSKMLDQAFGGKMVPELLNFLKVVARHGRFECLRAIRRSLRDLRNEAANVVEVHVKSAEPLTEEMQSRVAEQLGKALGSQVLINAETDPNLIGGLVVRVGDTVFDGSVANQLVQLRKTAVDKAVQEIRQSLDRFVLAE